MDYDNDTELQNKKKAKFDAVSKLDKEVRELVEMITSKEMIEKQLTDVGYDVKKMPLGKISGKMIDDGYEVR
jgi:poly [ADP-ribose] polymerase 2/3/4